MCAMAGAFRRLSICCVYPKLNLWPHRRAAAGALGEGPGDDPDSDLVHYCDLAHLTSGRRSVGIPITSAFSVRELCDLCGRERKLTFTAEAAEDAEVWTELGESTERRFVILSGGLPAEQDQNAGRQRQDAGHDRGDTNVKESHDSNENQIDCEQKHSEIFGDVHESFLRQVPGGCTPKKAGKGKALFVFHGRGRG